MAQRLTEIANELSEKSCIISSVSHAINRDRAEQPYEFVVVGRSVDA
jgi:hypothetical protein